MLDLNCDVMGVPSPAFTWFKDGKKLTTASKTLQIRFDSDESFGKYTCEASNNAGKHAVLFVIKEICKFSIFYLYKDHLFKASVFVKNSEIVLP